MRARLLPLTLLLPLLALGPALADEGPDAKAPAPGALTLATRRVVIFKDGHALFVRRGTALADDQGHVYTDAVPDNAVLGTFWAFSEGEALVGMQAQFVETRRAEERRETCLTLLDLLRVNLGRRVTIGLTDGKELAGVLKQVLDRPAPPDPEPPAPSAAHPPAERELLPQGGHLLVMSDTPRGEVVLPVALVQTLSAATLETNITRAFETRAVTKRMRFDLGPGRAGQEVALVVLHFGPDLRWIPTYRVGGDLSTSADLALQAEILNEAEDLDQVEASLVVGVPHFRFKEVVSPLSLEATLQSALRRAAPQLMGQMGQTSNVAFQSRAGERMGPTERSPMDLAPELAGEGSQDLFVYGVKALTLPKGARATLPLWQSTVPMEHLYALEVNLGRNVEGGGSYVRPKASAQVLAPIELARHEVWHHLELTNDSDVPWTTGAALTLDGQVPIGQDMITYTPVGASSLLPLTIAVDVRADFSEVESARQPKAITHGGYEYARIQKQATIRVRNFRSEATRFRATLALGGRVTEASDEGRIVINDFRPEDWSRGGHPSLNHHSDVEWNVELAPGEEKRLTCAYEFYLR